MERGGPTGVLLVAMVAVSVPVRPLSPAASRPPAAAAGTRAGQGPAREREREREPERTSSGAWDLAAADMNGDRRLDLVVATGGPGDERGLVEVLLNPGVDLPLDAWEHVALPARGDYGRLVVGDIDGDGNNDVAALTFGTRRLRWWLLGPDSSVLEEQSLVMGAAGAGPCPGPLLDGAAPQTLSALALADLDSDRALELAVTSYASGDSGRAFLFSFDRASRCFALRPGFPRATRGSLRVRFFDVDDDGALDMVASHYALAGAPGGAANALEWGSWWPSAAGEPRPLVARLNLRELMEATPTPELNIVDFDALRTPAGARFALAGSAHLCPAADCWAAGDAGILGVVDADGRQLYLSGAWKRNAELAPPFPGARLLPRAVSFRGSAEPSLIAGYWWATRHKASPCNRIEPCAGPLVESRLERAEPASPDGANGGDGAGSEAPATLDPEAFVQAIGLIEDPSGSIERRRSCVEVARPLLALPDAPVSAVLGVQLGERALPASAWSWTPASPAVALAPRYRHQPGKACVEYLTSTRAQLAIADSRSGARIIPL
jgi:VCBS repeat protein